jgi:beta-fructofuranosidase
VNAPDPAFPVVHVRPDRGWLNDPNGPFRWRGRYHLFFQHNPTAPSHGEICWGHASSADLATWRPEPVALAPSADGPDAAGCWSGCVVDDGGTPTAVYTGFTGDPRTATIVLARARDDELRGWTKVPEPVAVPPRELAGFRDPFLLELDGHRYAVVGAGGPDGTAEVLVYRCDDLLRWEYAGVLLTGADEVARSSAPAEIWECPQLFRLGARWVLVVSLVRDDALSRVAYLVGDLDVRDGAPRFHPAAGGLVDHGHDFYAPAVLVEEERVLLWGWSWEDRDPDQVLAAGWAGVLTWPRVLGLDGDRLTSRPAAELTRLRQRTTELSVASGPEPVRLPSGPSEVEAVLDARTSIALTRGAAGLTIELDPAGRRVELRRPAHDPARSSWPTEGTVSGTGPVELRLVLDGSVVEVYVAGGPVFTERVYPAGDAPWALTAQREPAGSLPLTVHRLGGSAGL